MNAPRLPAVLLSIAVACALAAPDKIAFEAVVPVLIQQRLELVVDNASKRQAILKSLFQEVGCDADRLSEQRVPGSKQSNVVCTLPVEGAGVIVVGGHLDKVLRGMRAVDDWSGVVLLPSLYQSLKTVPRHHQFVFVGFAAEEVGLVGSSEYVKRLSIEEKSRIRAMINLECLGLTPPKVWASRADKQLLSAYIRVAKALDLQVAASNVERIGDDDSHPFLKAKIPVLTIHSITQDTLRVLHSPLDRVKAIHPDDYYAAYRVAATYLAYLDSVLE